VLVELVEHQLRYGAALDLEHDAHALTIGLVTQGRDVLDLLGAHQRSDRLDQRGLVHLVGDLGDDYRRAAVRRLLDARPAAHPDTAAARLERLTDAFTADKRPGREVGALDVL